MAVTVAYASKAHEQIDKRLDTLRSKLEILKFYLRTKLAEHDWHGVQDAASDIREVKARINELRRLERAIA